MRHCPNSSGLVTPSPSQAAPFSSQKNLHKKQKDFAAYKHARCQCIPTASKTKVSSSQTVPSGSTPITSRQAFAQPLGVTLCSLPGFHQCAMTCAASFPVGPATGHSLLRCPVKHDFLSSKVLQKHAFSAPWASPLQSNLTSNYFILERSVHEVGTP